MITLPRKLFCFLLVGLATLAVASLCSIMQLPMHQAIVIFIVTWITLIALFEAGDSFQKGGSFPRRPED